jgi:CRP-like cAMP-binding protein
MSSRASPHILTANHILSALSRHEYPLLFSSLEPVNLERGKILYELDGPIRSAFFIMSGMVSLLATTEEGLTTQVGMVGSEGLGGVPVILKITNAPYQSIVQIPGRAMRIRPDVLVSEFARAGPLQDMLLRYVHSLICQISLSAACNRFHSLEQRLCRWLLISHDRVKSDHLPLTQEALSHMLGATRPNVTARAITLRKAGLLNYQHGRIQILDREGIESGACECYRVMTEICSFHAT